MGTLFIILAIVGAVGLIAAVFLALIFTVAHFWDALEWSRETYEEPRYEPIHKRGFG